MSEYVVHFTRQTEEGTAYDNVLSILFYGVVQAVNGFGIGRELAPDLETQRAVCLSEVPLHLISRIAERRDSLYGIGFTKRFILSRSGGPIWYVERDSPQARAVSQLMQGALFNDVIPANLIWRLTPFIDVVGDYATGPYRFEWEREWRHVGDLEFNVEDVAFLVIPEDLQAAARRFFLEHDREGTGPGYFCPFIDANWARNRIRATLNTN